MPMQESNFDGIFYLLRYGIYSYGFHPKIGLRFNFMKIPKCYLRQKVQPYGDALIKRLFFFFNDIDDRSSSSQIRGNPAKLRTSLH